MKDERCLIYPDWPAPKTVKSISTTRLGGVSLNDYCGNNLGLHVGDRFEHVMQNRTKLREFAKLPVEPGWLTQVHGTRVVDCSEINDERMEADASYSKSIDSVCVVMTADCLPILICDKRGKQVAAVHAGWRGLLNGVIESSLKHFDGEKHEIMAWLGPAIGQKAFEVGEDVYSEFIQKNEAARDYFQPITPGKFLMDIYGLAKMRLRIQGITEVYGGQYCTCTESGRFFSYRRDGLTGRMASLIWLDNS